MAYVPPHRRAKSSSKPETPPHSVNKVYKYPARDDDAARSNVFIWFPVDEHVNPPANVQLDFKPFAGRSFPHLEDKKLYTISVNPNPVDDVENDTRSLMINETHPWRYTCEKIKGALRECFQRLEKYVKGSKPNYAKPTFTARLGQNLFHGSNTLEKIWNSEISLQNQLRKVFYTHIPEDIFESLKEKTITSLESPILKEKVVYIVEVGDILNPNTVLRITCRKKGIDGKQLELKKIELHPIRAFVADTSCLKKLMDWRLSVTETYLIDLDEEDKESIEGIVNSACIDVSAKGGLQWPNGGFVRKRFVLIKTWTLNVTTIVGKTWDIKFQHADRAKFMDSSGMVSNEIDIKLKSITKYLRDRRQWEEENIMNILEDSLKWVWMKVLNEYNLVHKD
ncbi:uncharacterized protein LOC131068001 isoform X2 [Cryptomeria japonica]|uniref:uncharacterized protein LOC131068001 isoform X2 n=1 Tax=Cryptomeria japonica TaxID=3369 RepID=UPI0025AD5906|nr:uncharacterized protein LOC131068001 isoform X2 [Cryptomeria japonica]